MGWLEAHESQLFSLAVVLFAALVTRLTRLRPRLRYSVGHAWDMIVDEPLMDNQGKQVADKQLVRTASITLTNDGLQVAKAVELAFNWQPAIFNVWPARAFDEVLSNLGRFSLRFDSLAPGEQMTIEIMALNAPLPGITAVRSEDCVGEQVQMHLQRVYPTWQLQAGWLC